MIVERLLLVLFISWSVVAVAAEVELPSAAMTEDEADTVSETVTETASEAAPVVGNPCKGMADGAVLGIDACTDCHEEKVIGMRKNAHGQAADARTPYASDGCETCHGPGTTHFDIEGNCIISLRGRFGESVKLRNDICLGCHNSDMMHWPGKHPRKRGSCLHQLSCDSRTEPGAGAHYPGRGVLPLSQEYPRTNLSSILAPDPRSQSYLQ